MSISMGHSQRMFYKLRLKSLEYNIAPYIKVIKNRLNAFFSAYYSDDIVDMYAFCKKYNVSYVIINRDHFTYSYLNGRIYREPFNIQIKEQLSNKNDFALSHYGGKTIFDDETKYIINC